MKTLSLTTDNNFDDFFTTIKVDNSTPYKDFEINQGNLECGNKLLIQIDIEEDSIKIGDIILKGINKKVFLDFVNQ